MDKTPPYPGQQGFPQQGYGPPPQQGYAPPPQQGYPPQGAPPPYSQPPQQTQYGGASTTAVVVNTGPQAVFGAPILREAPVRYTCPHCRADIMTSTTYTSGTMVWLSCLLMFFFGFWLCCFIPFIVDGCKDVVHNCPNCSAVIGRYTRM